MNVLVFFDALVISKFIEFRGDVVHWNSSRIVYAREDPVYTVHGALDACQRATPQPRGGVLARVVCRRRPSVDESPMQAGRVQSCVLILWDLERFR